MNHARSRNLLVGAGGLLIGGVLLWLALRQFDAAQFRQTLAALNGWLIGLACGVYWSGMALRTCRWHGLLRELQPVRWAGVAETLVVGYGVNNLLPARLGELVRADYGKTLLGLHRSQLLGTIVIERMLDLTSVLGCLFAGLALGYGGHNAGFSSAVQGISRNGLALVAVVWLLLMLCRRRYSPAATTGLARMLRELLVGIASFNVRTGARALLFSVLIWSAEAIALWLVFQALQVGLTPGQTLVLIGVSSLSTLIPTAPGYVGSFQLVFVLAMAAFGIPETIGLVASISVQLFVFGSVTLVALGFYLMRWWEDYRRRAPHMQGPDGEKTAHG